MMQYKGMRFSYIEELEPSRVLNTQLIKDLNGGNPRVSARIPHSQITMHWNWSTTLFASFNQGKCPQLDANDTQVVQRIVTIPHVSKFTSDEDELDQPYTFAADVNIDEKFDGWRSDCLNWLLGGLREYYAMGFKNIPASCLTMKEKIVAGRDLVGSFIKSHVEKASSDEFVQLSVLWKEFKRVNAESMRDAKTKLTQDEFEMGVKAKLGAMEEQHMYKSDDGKRAKSRNAFVGWRFVMCDE